MGLLDWLFGTSNKGSNFYPEKYKWYSFYDIRKSNKDWTNALDRFEAYDALKVAPFAYIKGRKYRARFYLTKNYCEIIAGKNKIIVPLNRCSFRRDIKKYYQGQSHIIEYYITVVAHNVLKVDYDRYKRFKKK